MIDNLIQNFIKTCFEDYVNGLEIREGGAGTVCFKDLTLNTTRINEDMDEEGVPVTVDSGSIAKLILEPTWTGGVNLTIDGIKISLGISPSKVMKLGFGGWLGGSDPTPEPTDNRDLKKDVVAGAGLSPTSKKLAPAPGPARINRPEPRVPLNQSDSQAVFQQLQGQPHPHVMYGTGVQSKAVFCSSHASSEKRPKGNPRVQPCLGCNQELQTNYVDFAYCPKCSSEKNLCMVCGHSAPQQHNHSAREPEQIRQHASYDSGHHAGMELDGRTSKQLAQDYHKMQNRNAQEEAAKVGPNGFITRRAKPVNAENLMQTKVSARYLRGPRDMHFDTADPNSNFTTTPSNSSRPPQNGENDPYRQHIPQATAANREMQNRDFQNRNFQEPNELPYDSRYAKDDRRKASAHSEFESMFASLISCGVI